MEINIQLLTIKFTLFLVRTFAPAKALIRHFRMEDPALLHMGHSPSLLSPPTMHKLVLVRHGESTWNLENRFTGWTDVDLTPTGVEQAKNAGRLLKAEGYEFDLAYTSVLKRATRTLWHCLDEMDRTWLPVVHSWRLNERHYGALQGLNKGDMAKQ